MIQRQIHCVIDCLSYALEMDGRYDYRPMYIGVWDYPFEIHEEGISYYSYDITMDSLLRDVEEMYGVQFNYWIDNRKSKAVNFSILEQQMIRKDAIAVIVMVDLYYLPYSIHYRKKHLPHILLIQNRNSSEWFVADPYYGWEGGIRDFEMRQAFGCQDLNTGISLYINEPTKRNASSISRVFDKYAVSTDNNLPAKVKAYIRNLLSAENKNKWSELQYKIEDIVIISKRLRGYGPVYSYFANEMQKDEDGDQLQSDIADLVKRWEGFLLFIFRISITGKGGDMQSIEQKLDALEELERSIKRKLQACYEQWRTLYE